MKLYLLKFLNYFNFRNTFWVESEFNFFRSVIMFITYYPLLLCLIFRLFYIHRQPLRHVEILFVLLYFGSAFFYSIFIPRIRFRLPFDVLLIAHVGIIFSLQVDRMKQRQTNNPSKKMNVQETVTISLPIISCISSSFVLCISDSNGSHRRGGT